MLCSSLSKFLMAKVNWLTKPIRVCRVAPRLAYFSMSRSLSRLRIAMFPCSSPIEIKGVRTEWHCRAGVYGGGRGAVGCTREGMCWGWRLGADLRAGREIGLGGETGLAYLPSS